MVFYMLNTLKKLINEWLIDNSSHKIHFDESNEIIELEYDQRFYISLESSLNGEDFYIYSVIGNVPLETQSEVALEALKANLFGRETGKSTLAFEEKTNSLILFKRAPFYGLESQQFTSIFDEFLAYRLFWEFKYTEGNFENKEGKTSKLKGINKSLTSENKKIFYA